MPLHERSVYREAEILALRCDPGVFEYLEILPPRLDDLFFVIGQGFLADVEPVDPGQVAVAVDVHRSPQCGTVFGAGGKEHRAERRWDVYDWRHTCWSERDTSALVDRDVGIRVHRTRPEFVDWRSIRCRFIRREDIGIAERTPLRVHAVQLLLIEVEEFPGDRVGERDVGDGEIAQEVRAWWRIIKADDLIVASVGRLGIHAVQSDRGNPIVVDDVVDRGAAGSKAELTALTEIRTGKRWSSELNCGPGGGGGCVAGYGSDSICDRDQAIADRRWNSQRTLRDQPRPQPLVADILPGFIDKIPRDEEA